MRPKMERRQRAKQFMPFDALKGFKEALAKKEQEFLREILKEETSINEISDKRDYIDKEYDLLIDYDSLPFPIAESNENLIKNIQCFKKAEYETKLTDFMNKYGVREDGHASERAAKVISNLIDIKKEEENDCFE